MRPAQLPAGLAHFVGRGDDLDVLRASPAPSAVVIDGMAGIGKTSLALHWAHEVAPGFTDGQLYVNLRGFDADGRAADPAEVGVIGRARAPRRAPALRQQVRLHHAAVLAATPHPQPNASVAVLLTGHVADLSRPHEVPFAGT